MSRYAIYVCDNLYGGLHGMNYTAVIEANSSSAVDSWCHTYGMELIESYSDIYDTLEQDVDYNTTPDMSDEDVENLRYDIYQEDIDYTWEKIDEAKAKDYTTQQLDEMIYNLGYDEFVELYC